jgi:hypothetical protein
LFDTAADEEWRARSVRHQQVRGLEACILGVREKTAGLRAKFAEYEESVRRHESRRGKVLPTIDEDFNAHMSELQTEVDALESEHNRSVGAIERQLTAERQRRFQEVEDARKSP